MIYDLLACSKRKCTCENQFNFFCEIRIYNSCTAFYIDDNIKVIVINHSDSVNKTSFTVHHNRKTWVRFKNKNIFLSDG